MPHVFRGKCWPVSGIFIFCLLIFIVFKAFLFSQQRPISAKNLCQQCPMLSLNLIKLSEKKGQKLHQKLPEIYNEHQIKKSYLLNWLKRPTLGNWSKSPSVGVKVEDYFKVFPSHLCYQFITVLGPISLECSECIGQYRYVSMFAIQHASCSSIYLKVER